MDAYLQSGLAALGDSTRMAIFQLLANGPLAVTDLAGKMPVSRPAVSQHLKILKDAGLVNETRSGNRHIYQLNPEGHSIARFPCSLSKWNGGGCLRLARRRWRRKWN